MENRKTILGKIIVAIILVFKENWIDFLKKLWKKVPDELKVKLSDIVDIVERIKTYVDSPSVDLITEAIPGNVDDRAVEWLRKLLHNVLIELNLHEKSTMDYSNSDLHNIATRMTQEVTGLSYGQSAITIENAFQNLKKV